METRKTGTPTHGTKKVRTTVMNQTASRPKTTPETAVKKVFGSIGPTGVLPGGGSAGEIFAYKEAEAKNFEKGFSDCMEHSNNTVEQIVLLAYQTLRSEAQNLSKEIPLEAKALNTLADHIEEGFRAWYPLIEASRKADREHAKMIRSPRR